MITLRIRREDVAKNRELCKVSVYFPPDTVIDTNDFFRDRVVAGEEMYPYTYEENENVSLDDDFFDDSLSF